MSLKQGLIAEMKHEASSTRRMLERVPTDKNDWKPHEKSMPLGRLASHIADLTSWTAFTLASDELDLATMDYKPFIASSTEELIAHMDANLEKAISALENAEDEDLDKMWTLRRGDMVFFTMPKKAVMRNMSYSHLYHHRGQLSVYLRLLDIPVPGMYGPTADEMIAPKEEAASAN